MHKFNTPNILILLLCKIVSFSAFCATFEISNNVVRKDVSAFSATIDEFGNGAKLSGGGAFEPTVFRTQFLVSKVINNRIYLNKNHITHYDSWKEGALDNAEVEILRIDSEQFISVGKSFISEGGHKASGWWQQLNHRVIPSTTLEFDLSIPKPSKLNAPYYYMVKTIDSQNRLSAPSSFVVNIPTEHREPLLNLKEAEKLKVETEPSTISAPSNVRITSSNQGRKILKWDGVRGAKAYAIYRSDYSPKNHNGFYIAIKDNSLNVKAGDLIILRKKFYQIDRQQLISNRVWEDFNTERAFRQQLLSTFSNDEGAAKWSLEKHQSTSTVTASGETYLAAQVEKNGPLTVGKYNYSGTQQKWYEVLNPLKNYVFSVWLRGDSNLTATIHLPNESKSLALTSKWTKHEILFTVPELYEDKKPRIIKLTVEGEGRVNIDNFQLYRGDAAYQAFLPEDLSELKKSGLKYLRTHGFIKTFFNTYNLEQITNSAGLATTSYGNTLVQTLDNFEKANVNPWLQIEPHFSSEEWLGLLEYIAAPYEPGVDSKSSKPWAYKRFQQGRPKPFIDSFDSIILELGNETWNSMFSPWTFKPMTDAKNNTRYSAAQVYGLYQEYILGILSSSPYWKYASNKIKAAIGGWAINNYGQVAAAMSPSSSIITVAEYIGGWDQGEPLVADNVASYNSVLSSAPQVAERRAKQHMDKIADLTKRNQSTIIMGTYEAGPGYLMNGLNNAKVNQKQYIEQEKVMKSVAAATATADTFLTQLRAGYDIQTFFKFARGDFWSSHQKWYEGGNAHTAWEILSFINNEGSGLGSLLKVHSLEVRTQNLPSIGRRDSLNNMPEQDIYPFLKNKKLTVIVIDRHVSQNDNINDTVHVKLPQGKWKITEKWGFKGTYMSTNLDSERTRFVKTNLNINIPDSNEFSDSISDGSVNAFVLEKVN